MKFDIETSILRKFKYQLVNIGQSIDIDTPAFKKPSDKLLKKCLNMGLKLSESPRFARHKLTRVA